MQPDADFDVVGASIGIQVHTEQVVEGVLERQRSMYDRKIAPLNVAAVTL